MKLTQLITLSFIAVLLLFAGFTNAQTLQKTTVLPSSTIQALPTESELKVELEQIDQEIAYLERLLVIYDYYCMDSKAQLVYIDLQDAKQRQQQIIQTMSNISKVLHDTSLSIIRKIG